MSTERPTTDGGYSQEDSYFKQQEMELLKKKRLELDAARQRSASEQRAGEYWMRCPKCGNVMEEIKLDPVMVDKCRKCGGIYFDAGELEMLTKGLKGGGFFTKLFG